MFGKKKENEEESLSKELQKKISENLVVLDHVSKVYSNGLEAVHDFSLEIKKRRLRRFSRPFGVWKVHYFKNARRIRRYNRRFPLYIWKESK